MKAAIFSGIIAAAMLVAVPRLALADSVTVSVNSPATVSLGSSFAVDVNVSNATDLYDFQLDLSFDPTILQATNVLEGSFLPGGGSTIFIPGAIDNAAGDILFNADTLETAIAGVNGSGTLLEFDFTALASGTSSLNLGNIILQDSLGDELQNSSINGSVTVSKGGVVTTPEPNSLVLLIAAIGVVGILAQAKRSFPPHL